MKNIYDYGQIISAYIMLISGVCLAVAGFCTPPRGEVSDSVLWYVAQCLIYAGSAFGLTAYVDNRINAWKDGKTAKNDGSH